MFSLKIIDHVRLDSERVAQNYTVHAAAAERTVRIIRTFRIAIAALLALAASTEIANAIFPRSLYPGVAIGASVAALVAFTIYASLGLESSLFAHRVVAHRLWLIVERYRSLLAEVNDDVVDTPMLVRRRDELIANLDTIYQFAFGVEQAAYENLRLPSVSSDRAA